LGGDSQATTLESGNPLLYSIPPMANSQGDPQRAKMRRISVIKLVPDKDAEAKLKALCSLSSKLYEVTYVRRRQFFNKGVDLRGTYKEFYERYKVIGSATVQQILNKNNEAWISLLQVIES